ncbi:hypothetical protein QBC47DRAFT_364770 [Echria macrotheca]|uniref:Uncharacterized protein n=1 Tax=Echria macrotheca TaxID=438768 RepID=A0AAJ0B361_9PEZI|nr:hypothetical protein QBC47DRAFT_364770 [Echria macrotheca]
MHFLDAEGDSTQRREALGMSASRWLSISPTHRPSVPGSRSYRHPTKSTNLPVSQPSAHAHISNQFLFASVMGCLLHGNCGVVLPSFDWQTPGRKDQRRPAAWAYFGAFSQLSDISPPVGIRRQQMLVQAEKNEVLFCRYWAAKATVTRSAWSLGPRRHLPAAPNKFWKLVLRCPKPRASQAATISVASLPRSAVETADFLGAHNDSALEPGVAVAVRHHGGNSALGIYRSGTPRRRCRRFVRRIRQPPCCDLDASWGHPVDIGEVEMAAKKKVSLHSTQAHPFRSEVLKFHDAIIAA